MTSRQKIHRQNAMLKTTKQRVVTNLNDINMMVIEMEISDTANFGESGMFTLEKHFCIILIHPTTRFSAALRQHK
jgi:tyrosine-protein phosphatase YwqE